MDELLAPLKNDVTRVYRLRSKIVFCLKNGSVIKLTQIFPKKKTLVSTFECKDLRIGLTRLDPEKIKLLTQPKETSQNVRGENFASQNKDSNVIKSSNASVSHYMSKEGLPIVIRDENDEIVISNENNKPILCFKHDPNKPGQYVDRERDIILENFPEAIEEEKSDESKAVVNEINKIRSELKSAKSLAAELAGELDNVDSVYQENTDLKEQLIETQEELRQQRIKNNNMIMQIKIADEKSTTDQKLLDYYISKVIEHNLVISETSTDSDEPTDKDLQTSPQLESDGQETVVINEAHDDGAIIIGSGEDQKPLTIKVKETSEVIQSIKIDETQNDTNLNDPLQSAGQEMVVINETQDDAAIIIGSGEDQKPLTIKVEETSEAIQSIKAEKTQNNNEINDSLVADSVNDRNAPTIISSDEEDVTTINLDEDQKPLTIKVENTSEVMQSIKTDKTQNDPNLNDPFQSAGQETNVVNEAHDDGGTIIIGSDEDEKPSAIKVEETSGPIQRIKTEKMQNNNEINDSLVADSVNDRNAPTIISSDEEDVIAISSDEDQPAK